MTSKLMQKAMQVKAEGFLNHYRRELADAHGAVTISKIAFEAIGILVLIIVLVLIPVIGNAVETAMPAPDPTSPWADFIGQGATMWGTVAPIITVCVLVTIVGLVLKVIWDLKKNNN